ncbi:MAG: 4-hydroxy-tetrahydrodipicolinate synthase [Alphaproteobacteria bacterium]|nr:4-hydroxy-tetrahydrodipicolinate synthase [Alphaproteobacteria bacterium]
MFTGIITALITPFKNGKIDEEAFRKLVEWQIAEGVNGLVPCGTTGESPTLSHEEHKRVVELCIETARGRVPVIAGAGSNSTAEAIDFAHHAKKAGASGVLVVAPYYNKPSQEGIYRHYKAVHDAVSFPILIYNIPARSVVNITDETLARLAKLPHIDGVKDATGDLARVSSLRMAAGPGFCQLSGEDMTALAFNAAGGRGCISVTSNIAPRLCAELQKLTLQGDFAAALKIQDQLAPLHKAMFCEPSPGPVKYAASLLGLASAEVRLPLTEISDAAKQQVEAALKTLGLLDGHHERKATA